MTSGGALLLVCSCAIQLQNCENMSVSSGYYPSRFVSGPSEPQLGASFGERSLRGLNSSAIISGGNPPFEQMQNQLNQNVFLDLIQAVRETVNSLSPC